MLPPAPTPDPAALGGRLPLLAPAALTPAQHRVYERVTTVLTPKAAHAGYQTTLPDGPLIGPFNALLYSPELGEGFLAYAGVEVANSSLSARVRQLVILAVGAYWQSPYELYAHQAEARAAGFSAAEAQALAAGHLVAGLADDERLAYQFTYALTSQRQVAEDLYQQAQAHYGRRGLLDLVLLAARYHMTCVVLNAFSIPAP